LISQFFQKKNKKKKENNNNKSQVRNTPKAKEIHFKILNGV